MRKIKRYSQIESIPEYALNYLINDDQTGLNDDDLTNIKNYLTYWDIITADLPKRKTIIFSLFENDTESFFSNYPAFGLPCMCVKCNVTVLL